MDSNQTKVFLWHLSDIAEMEVSSLTLVFFRSVSIKHIIVNLLNNIMPIPVMKK